jgi:ParB family chromosome partitioning protein
MATAIGDAAEAIRRREEAAAAIRAENDALAHEYVRLKGLGLVMAEIPLDAIETTKLVRDRNPAGDLDLAELIASIRDVGLSNPIRVEPRADGRYELIQGLRRLSAYRALLAETGDDRWARIPAGIIPAGQDLSTLYRRMVDENMIRKDVSFAEMAALARGYASDMGVELDSAVNALFASAAPQKRSYVRRFALLLMRLDKVLEHAPAIPRALGLALAQRLEDRPELTRAVADALRAVPRRSAEQELAILRRFAEDEAPALAPGPPAPPKPRRGRPARRGKTVLRLPYAAGEVKCTATAGRIELAADRDFAALPPDRLEAATLAFLRALE